jgi:transposase-like protein
MAPWLPIVVLNAESYHHTASVTGCDSINCRQHGISRATLHRWKQQYRDLAVPDLRRLNALEAENARLKRLVADHALDNQMLKDLLGKRS